MIEPPIPDDEIQRLRALRELQIFDTKGESAFDGLISLAAYVCNTSIALISLVDSDRQWFKSRHNFPIVCP